MARAGVVRTNGRPKQGNGFGDQFVRNHVSARQITTHIEFGFLYFLSCPSRKEQAKGLDYF
jgi:hypothetical protein